jgi:hypothetical protein
MGAVILSNTRPSAISIRCVKRPMGSCVRDDSDKGCSFPMDAVYLFSTTPSAI